MVMVTMTNMNTNDDGDGLVVWWMDVWFNYVKELEGHDIEGCVIKSNGLKSGSGVKLLKAEALLK